MARGPGGSADGGRGGLRVFVLGLGLVFAASATGVLVVTEDPKLLRLAVVGALWAFVLATIATPRRRVDLPAEFSPQHELELRRTYELELEREVAARREYEMQLEVYLRRELDSGMREQVEALRDEVQRLHGEVIDRLDGELRMERIETTRLIGGSLRALREEARRLGITFGDESRFPFDESTYSVEASGRVELPVGMEQPAGPGAPAGSGPQSGPLGPSPGPPPGGPPVDERSAGYPPDQSSYRPFLPEPAPQAAGPPAGYAPGPPAGDAPGPPVPAGAAGPPGGYPGGPPAEESYYPPPAAAAAPPGYPGSDPVGDAVGGPGSWLPDAPGPDYPGDYPSQEYPAAAYPGPDYSGEQFDPADRAGYRVAEYAPVAEEQPWDDTGYGLAQYPGDQPPAPPGGSPFRSPGQYPAEPVYPAAQPAAPPPAEGYGYPGEYGGSADLDDHGYRDEPDYPGNAPRNDDELSRILAGSPPPSPRSPRVDNEDTASGRRRRYRDEDEPNEVLSRLLGRN